MGREDGCVSRALGECPDWAHFSSTNTHQHMAALYGALARSCRCMVGLSLDCFVAFSRLPHSACGMC